MLNHAGRLQVSQTQRVSMMQNVVLMSYAFVHHEGNGHSDHVLRVKRINIKKQLWCDKNMEF